MTVRAKFQCTSVKKYKATRWDETGKMIGDGMVYAYEFQAVSGNSDENKKFFASTPTGNLSLHAVRDDLFEPGEYYYLDFEPASASVPL